MQRGRFKKVCKQVDKIIDIVIDKLLEIKIFEILAGILVILEVSTSWAKVKERVHELLKEELKKE